MTILYFCIAEGVDINIGLILKQHTDWLLITHFKNLTKDGCKVFTKFHTTEEVLAALSKIRINLVTDEYRLHDIITKSLNMAGIFFKREYKLSPHNRIDYLVNGGIGVEVKKGKPYSRQVIEQLKRYAVFPEITAIILVVERNLDIPKQINGKMCCSFGLNKLWGIAL